MHITAQALSEKRYLHIENVILAQDNATLRDQVKAHETLAKESNTLRERLRIQKEEHSETRDELSDQKKQYEVMVKKLTAASMHSKVP